MQTMTPSRTSTPWVKLAIAWSAAFLIRLIPFRPSNFEPLLATLMPFSKRCNAAVSFAFGFLSIALYDLVTSGIGEWTYVTALAYGALGVAATLYFQNRAATRTNFLAFGIVGTLVYDAITGLTVGPLFHHQSFSLALAGQIPFTLAHLAGTIAFTLVLSPMLYRWIAADEAVAPVPALATR
jgi:hypothetical protein